MKYCAIEVDVIESTVLETPVRRFTLCRPWVAIKQFHEPGMSNVSISRAPDPTGAAGIAGYREQ